MKTVKSFRILIYIVVLVVIFSGLTVPVRGQDNTIGSTIITDFDVSDTDIRDVFRSLAELGNLNVLFDKDVQGQASVKLKNGMTIKEAIELLAQTYNYSYRWITTSRTVIIGNEKTFANFDVNETRVYHLNFANPEQVAQALEVMIPKERMGIDLRTNQLTIRASVLEQQNVADIITRLDQEMPQINVEARIEEVSTNYTKKLGVGWDFPVTNSGINFRLTTIATLNALEEQGKSKLIANPNISTTDSQPGKIFLGDKFPILSSSQTNNGITYSVTYIEVGTTLTVIPRINNDQTVTVNIAAGVADITDWKKSGNDDVPVIRTREASSVVRLQQGETFVLSGLNYNNQLTTDDKVPGISKIPIIGKLFQTKKTGQNQDTEILIFLTPKVVFDKNKTPMVTPLPSIAPSPAPSLTVIEQPKATPSPTAVPTPTPVITPTPNPVVSVMPFPTPAISTSPIPVVKATPAPTMKSGVTAVPTTEGIAIATPIPTPMSTVSPSSGLNVGSQVNTVIEQGPVPTADKPNSVAVSSPIPTPTPSPIVIATNPAGAPISKVLTPGLEGLKINYKVKTGETIDKVGSKFGVMVDSILNENKLKRNSAIANKTLVIPIPQEHLYPLKAKETLWRLAKRYGTTVELLKEINNIKDESKIETGQMIVLPVAAAKIVNKQY